MANEPEKVVPPAEASVAEPEKAAPPPTTGPTDYFAVADVVLRLLVFASALVSVVVMSVSKQTEMVPTPFPPYRAPLPAKFNHSPALIYFVAAFSVAGFFSIITTLGSLYSLTKPGCSAKIISHFIIIDVLLLGIVASATGAAASVAYIGLKGNTHVGWGKVCNMYGKFCRYLGASIGVSLFSTVLLLLLVLLSVYSKKIPK
ncbi:CASP-like protein 1 [Nicotiana tabacum]|uniref:CASP-like protein n=2 Tax=Nicotiana TaxID=4085 RepID=A0A1S3YD19_TOBAC|nr:PREDICTED: CASP-like protein 1 [Nicotiana sylvestris]XP_016450110.1 PREDICTED: CASP-like protein 1 [Nicotiana tabacum]